MRNRIGRRTILSNGSPGGYATGSAGSTSGLGARTKQANGVSLTAFPDLPGDAMGQFQHLNPDGVADPSRIYSHVVVPPPGRVVFFAGQWGGDLDGRVVDGGFEAQVERALANVQTHLAAVGIGPAQVTKLTHYVVDLDEEKRRALHGQVGTIWATNKPASTLLGVARLARAEMMYEVDAQAVLPD